MTKKKRPTVEEACAELAFHHVPPSVCPSCGAINDAATDPTGKAAPKPGDISLCFRCGHLCAFADDLTLRALTDAEMIDIAGDPMIVAINNARGKLHATDDD